MLFERLQYWGAHTPDKVAIVHGPRRVTYAELAELAARVAAFLSDLPPGERVAVVSDNSPEYAAIFFGIHQAGAIAVEAHPQSTPHELGALLEQVSPAVLFVEQKSLAAFEKASRPPSLRRVVVLGGSELTGVGAVPFSEVRARAPGAALGRVPEADDPSTLVFTSGSTGRAKGVVLTHDNLLANAESITAYLKLTASDSVMAVLPFCYSYGRSLLTTHVLAGGTLVLENSFAFPNVVLDKMVAERTTGLAGVPSTFAILLARSNIRAYRFEALRYVTQAGGAMSAQQVDALAGVLPGAAVYVMYGQTEATARLAYLDPADLPRKRGAIGKAIPGVELDLVGEDGRPCAPGETGEIVARGRNVMRGYWQAPEATQQALRNGWLHTGDLATRDAEGFFFFVGRRDELIKTGGHRVAPKEVEDEILQLPQVAEVAVVGVPEPLLGEAVKAYVVLREGAAPLELSALRAHCGRRLAAFKVPQALELVKELPKTGSGKVRRALLKR